MLESLRCPSCSTHYGLKPQRVRTGIRRAKCFRCGNLFDIQEAVERLLAPVPAEAPLAEPALEEVPGLAASDLAGIDFQEELFQELAAPAPEEAPDALNMEDLDTVEASMEATLVDFTPPPPSDSHYSSAKDAISRLLGDVPLQPTPRPLPTSRTSSPMDVEATLEALENTLGGVQPAEIAQSSSVDDLGSTVRIKADDIQAALAQAPMPEDVNPAAQTLSMPIPDLTKPAPAMLPPQPTITVPTAQDPNLLKLKIGEDLYENLTVDQISTWIEQGRVLDNHQVARQFSENWIEASKVPSLRPVFDRMKRLRSVLSSEEAPAPTPAPAPEPAKKSLFGGLFGRN